MATIDEQILAAVDRANSWGDVVESKAAAAVSGVNSFSSWGVSTSSRPGFYATLPAVPACDDLFDADALREQLQKALDQFFSAYYPPTDAYDAAVAWVLDAFDTSDPKLPGAGFATIWARAGTHLAPLGIGVDGLQLPVDAQAAHTTNAVSSLAAAETYAYSVTKADLWQHAAALKLRDLRTAAIVATGDYILSLVRVDVIALNAKTEMYSAEQRLKEAAAAWYAAQYGAVRELAARDIIRLQEEFGLAAATASHSAYAADLMVKSAIGGADAVAKIAQATQAAINNIVSASQVGF